MLIKIFGGIDLFAAIILLLSIGADPNLKLLLFFAALLFIKSLFGMLKDFASWIDFLSAIILIALHFIPIPNFIIIILALLLIQKGLFSFLSF
ncbi:hypothetical protein HN832_01820 [archaeon]|nr:hypothetical protein [archaeon]MBT4373090.1 hypothetical protein [archaeon]MBT7001387.1 hypothetical protein [archaeon]MBT7282127.1 hypothetical protein [archaeon]